MPPKGSTIRDVARRAGVSIATVSRVINEGGGISGETTARVQKAIRELKYRRSQAYVSRGPTRTLVSLFVPDVEIMNPHFLGIMKGIYDAAAAFSCGIFLQAYGGYDETGAGFREEARGVDAQGVLFIPSAVVTAEALGPGDGWPPLVFVDRTLPGVDACSVTVDTREGAGNAARYLASLGHRDIAYVGGPAALSTEKARREGLLRGLADAGLRLDPANDIAGGGELQQARAAVEERLRSPRTFTALLTASDVMAFGAREALDRAGLRVPGDVSLVGFDDIPFSAALGLTTVAQPAYLMGKNAMALLMDLVAGRVPRSRHDVLQPGLSIRSTCRRHGT
jgi:DNA-binding LacI/PurR family transcriptional regulator